MPSSKPSPRLAPAVGAPLDARGISACDLLTPTQLAELGLDPSSARSGTAGSAQTCGWTRNNDVSNPAGLQINTDPAIPSLDGLYLVRDTFAVFKPIEIFGHPALHADDVAGPVCTIYTAIADYQAVSTDGNLAGRPLIPRRSPRAGCSCCSNSRNPHLTRSSRAGRQPTDSSTGALRPLRTTTAKLRATSTARPASRTG
jgi:hypothetical protein